MTYLSRATPTYAEEAHLCRGSRVAWHTCAAGSPLVQKKAHCVVCTCAEEAPLHAWVLPLQLRHLQPQVLDSACCKVQIAICIPPHVQVCCKVAALCQHCPSEDEDCCRYLQHRYTFLDLLLSHTQQ